MLLKSKSRHFAINSFDLNRLNNPLFFFIYHTRDLYISSRFTSLIHLAVMLFITYCGEFFIMLVGGFFNTSESLFGATSLDVNAFALTSYFVGAYHLVKSIQLLILSLFYTATVYIIALNLTSGRFGFTAALILSLPIITLQLYSTLLAIMQLI